MENALLDFTTRVTGANDRENAFDAAVPWFRSFGFEHGGFGRISDARPVIDDLLTTAPLSYWQTFCRERRDRTEFTMLYARDHQAPLFSRVDKACTDYLPPEVRREAAKFAEFAPANVFVTPEPPSAQDRALGRVGMLAWASDLQQPEFEEVAGLHGPALVLASYLLMERLGQLPGGIAIDENGTVLRENGRAPRSGFSDCKALSPREGDCLLWLSRGLRNERIAETLGIAPATVEMHLRRARRKLDARTREQAVAVAVLNGLISP